MLKIQNPVVFRENMRNKLKSIFANIVEIGIECDIDVNIDNTTIDNIFENLEKGVYNYTIREAKYRKIVKKWENPPFVQLYIDRLRSIYINLKDQNILIALLQQEILPQNLAFMTHQELNPEHWKELIDKKIKKDKSKLNENIQASTNMFTCKKCKSKKCTYYELQTRSADEPTTIFVTCLDCGKNWKT
jgi:DNA-directed RNA polymerase subunit M/transcription elongation factor TFIIS